MNRIIIAAAIVGLCSTMAIAQSGGGSGGSAGSSGAGSGVRSGTTGGAPVGHAQPRRSNFNNETGTGAGNINQVDPADAALDRKIKSICRGC